MNNLLPKAEVCKGACGGCEQISKNTLIFRYGSSGLSQGLHQVNHLPQQLSHKNLTVQVLAQNEEKYYSHPYDSLALE